MTVHTPLRCANSVMSADPAAAANKKVVLLNTGNYPSFSNFLNETWIFTGTDWTNLSAGPINPSPVPLRSNACMAYDGYNVMMFGGQGGSSTSGVLNDTWTWGSSGQTWTQQSPATVPFARYGAEAAYLATVGGGGGTVMFGGTNLLYQLLETWVWDGGLKTWTQISVPNGTGPAARTGHVMASSPTLVLLFGGQGTNSQFNDTWTFNGSTWAKLSPATSPSVRSNAVMAYDTAGSRWVLFGGENEYNYLPETWTFDGTTWTQLAVTNGAGPSGRIGAQMAYDSQSGYVTLFGGISATSNYPSNETWQLQSNTWVQL